MPALYRLAIYQFCHRSPPYVHNDRTPGGYEPRPGLPVAVLRFTDNSYLRVDGTLYPLPRATRPC